MSYFKRLVVTTLTFISLTVLFPDMFYVRSFMVAIAASIVLSLLNTIIKPILVLFSLPLTLLTFGLFSFVINGFLLQMTSHFVGRENFGFSSFGAAMLIAIIMSIVNTIVLEHQLEKNF